MKDILNASTGVLNAHNSIHELGKACLKKSALLPNVPKTSFHSEVPSTRPIPNNLEIHLRGSKTMHCKKQEVYFYRYLFTPVALTKTMTREELEDAGCVDAHEKGSLWIHVC